MRSNPIKNILLLCGGGGSEHDISLLSVQYFEECLRKNKHLNVIRVEIQQNGQWYDQNNQKVWLTQDKLLMCSNAQNKTFIDYAIPCIHGYPGETGDIQSLFEMIGLPYLGSNSETSKICFNKITTKLWATALGIPNTPHLFIYDFSDQNQQRVMEFQKNVGDLIVKASNQGSSVGCYPVSQNQDPRPFLKNAFQYSPFVLVEKKLKPRELEVAVYEYEGQIQVTDPGEIIPPDSSFYSFSEKYSSSSQTQTMVRAQHLEPSQIDAIKNYAYKLFLGLKIRHLARIDFFLHEDQIYLNEINTFPGMTPISMFPKMMKANHHDFEDFLHQFF